YMFHMMNEARIGVGMGATALGYTGYLKSLEYARQRPQGRPVSGKDPVAPQVPLVQHADVRRMLLAQKSYVEGALALILFCSTLLDDQHTAETQEERDRAALLLDVLTPITKSWPSQWGLAANDLAIQIHGGYGYTREYDVEQHYRDNRLNRIHEGTDGIQGMDLLGRKVVMQGGQGLGLLVQTITATIERAGGGRATDPVLATDDPAAAASSSGDAARFAAELQSALDRLVQVTAAVWAPMDPEAALANATIYLEAAGHIVVAWIWLEQWLTADGHDGDFYDGKRQAAQYFFTYELPKVGPQLDLLARLDRTTLEMQDSWF
ncbi:acyl-CoA dehydrogenase, partial [bacterium]